MPAKVRTSRLLANIPAIAGMFAGTRLAHTRRIFGGLQPFLPDLRVRGYIFLDFKIKRAGWRYPPCGCRTARRPPPGKIWPNHARLPAAFQRMADFRRISYGYVPAGYPQHYPQLRVCWVGKFGGRTQRCTDREFRPSR
jgi:hypothetical protein